MITKENVSKYISIDEESEPIMFQMRVSNSCVLPAVNLELEPTSELDKLADDLRERRGYIPCFNGENVDCGGWYDFTIDLYGKHEESPENNVGSSIMFRLSDCCDSEAKDKGKEYDLCLFDEERKVIYDYLNEQCKEVFNQTADELIEECEREVMLG